MAMSQNEIYNLALQVGLSSGNAKKAAAVAMAESDGNTNAHNKVPPDDSYGLWQINMIGTLGPARRRQFGITTNDQLFDPVTNAKAMKAVSSNGGNFNPWSTYGGTAYHRYLANEVSDGGHDRGFWSKFFNPDLPGYLGGKSVTDTVKDNPVTNTAQAAAQGAEIAGKAAVWISDSSNWIRVAYVVGGVTIGIVGLIMIVQQTGPGKAVTKAAVAVGTKGVMK